VYRRCVELYGSDVVGRVDGTVRDLDVRRREFRKSIVITTFEELAITFRRWLAKNYIPRKIYVVIDEFHNVLQDRRKYSLLFILTLCRLWNIPTIIMSATIPQLRELSNYLQAKSFDFGSNIENKVIYTHIVEEGKLDFACQLATKYANLGLKVAIFYESRRGVKDIFIKLVDDYGRGDVCLCYRGFEESDTCVEGIREGKYNIVASTSMLGEGVNLPLDVAIILVNHFTKSWKIVQMMGRVGRAGLSRVSRGIVHIVYDMDTKKYVEDALREDYGKIIVDSLEDLIISYASQKVTTSDLYKLVKSTFGCEDVTEAEFIGALSRVEKLKIIRRTKSGYWRITKLGLILNKFNVLFREYTTFLDCFKLYGLNLLKTITCTLCRLGEVEPEISSRSLEFMRELNIDKLFPRELDEVDCTTQPLGKKRKTRCSWWVTAFLQGRPIWVEGFDRWLKFLSEYLRYIGHKHVANEVDKCLEAINRFYKRLEEGESIIEAREELLTCLNLVKQIQL